MRVKGWTVAVGVLVVVALIAAAIPGPADRPTRPAVAVQPPQSDPWSTTPEPMGEEKVAAARLRWPIESLVDRLPTGKPIPPARPLSAEARERWAGIDRSLTRAQEWRAGVFKALHERTRQLFVDTPGAGVGRTWRLHTDERVLNDDLYGGDPRQPGPPADFPDSSGEPLARVEPDDEFHFHHDGGLSAFLHPEGFGYVRDRRQVAGFQSHGFRYWGVPVHEQRRWRVDHVQLVGLLMYPDPVVYLTDRLPSMEQARRCKTRPPDPFEEPALAELRDGEDLSVVRKGDTVRMLGALRATQTCLKCHDAGVGDLLGALSYTLRPAPPARKVGDQ